MNFFGVLVVYIGIIVYKYLSLQIVVFLLLPIWLFHHLFFSSSSYFLLFGLQM